MSDGEKESNEGKFKDQRSKGLAISEFLDDSEVNRSGTDPWESEQDLAPAPRRTSAQTFGRAVEIVIANPTLVIATVAALPLLLVAWGLARPRRKKTDRAKPELPPHPL